MNGDGVTLDRLKATKRAHEARLMQMANVVAVGIGYRRRGGKTTDELAIVVSVKSKVAPDHLDAENTIPAEIDGVPVDVQVVGVLKTGEDKPCQPRND